jgi:hypothetical protein
MQILAAPLTATIFALRMTKGVGLKVARTQTHAKPIDHKNGLHRYLKDGWTRFASAQLDGVASVPGR